jgi:hypothetical protein
MKTSGSLQEFIELITAEVRKMTPEQKREFREAWLAASDRSLLRLTSDDVGWLRRIRINPSGD